MLVNFILKSLTINVIHYIKKISIEKKNIYLNKYKKSYFLHLLALDKLILRLLINAFHPQMVKEQHLNFLKKKDLYSFIRIFKNL